MRGLVCTLTPRVRRRAQAPQRPEGAPGANRMRRPAAAGRQGYAALPKYNEDSGVEPSAQPAAAGPHAALGPSCGPFCMVMLALQVQTPPPTLP